MSWSKHILHQVARLIGRRVRPPRIQRAGRGSVSHVIILDGTMSSLIPGRETNAGLTYKLLSQTKHANMTLYYEPGVQWPDWRRTGDVMTGRGINRQIRRAYGFLASRYRPGDKIFLFGFSRGAYAVRSLAGVIDQVGLLKRHYATERHVETAYRHYRDTPGRTVAEEFSQRRCHRDVEIEMIGVWDTVKALGLCWPVIWRFSQPQHAFHNDELGPHILHGYHALALDETRDAYRPVLWRTKAGEVQSKGRIEQVWFRGTHGDVGGQLDGFESARPLSNIPLNWILDKAETHGLTLPNDWRLGFPTDPFAPSIGMWRGWARIFLFRSARTVGQDASERLHDSANRSPPEIEMVPQPR